ncbi:hypothetical protein Csa_006181 [Cucumis sativus]|uniref:Uncharacterized protein n=1 Tax=Cucumis sativus TaxID=3659 RepID=A0A0A0LI36_CUCSA|nr:hypothetical protein Csa_006181 [Cucumis sativus]
MIARVSRRKFASESVTRVDWWEAEFDRQRLLELVVGSLPRVTRCGGWRLTSDDHRRWFPKVG